MHACFDSTGDELNAQFFFRGCSRARFDGRDSSGVTGSHERLVRADQGIIERCAEILAADDFDKAGFAEHVERLAVQSAQNHGTAGTLHALDNALQGIQCRGIHRANQVQAQNEHARQLANSLQGVLHFLRRAKEERAKDSINEDPVGNLLSLGDLLRGFERVLVGYQRHFRGLRNPVDEQDCGKHHAHFNRHHEIENYRENKGRQEDQCVAARHQIETAELVPLTHSERHHYKDCGHRRDRYVNGMPGKDQHHEEQREAMDDFGNWSSSAIVGIGRRAGDGSGGGKPAKERADDVGDPLRDKFRVAVVPVARKPIRHCRGKQGLDGSKQRDCRRWFIRDRIRSRLMSGI